MADMNAMSATQFPGFAELDAANRRLSEQVQDLWVSFAQGQTPTTAETTWTQYDEDTRSTLIMDTDLRVESDPYPAARQAWGELSFNGAEPGLEGLTPFQYAGVPRGGVGRFSVV